MTFDKPITNGREHTSPEWIREQHEYEKEETEALERMVSDSAIARFEEVRDNGRMSQVLRLTPAMWRELGPAERRMLLDWTVQRAELLEAKIAFMSRNICVGELEIPDYLREQGAA